MPARHFHGPMIFCAVVTIGMVQLYLLGQFVGDEVHARPAFLREVTDDAEAGA